MGNLITSFNDLQVWKEAHQLVLLVYQLSKKFPKEELFGLCSQVRRASVSVSCNIVEGFHRRSPLDSLRFYNMSEASLEEVKYEMIVARDLKYNSLDEYNMFFQKANKVGALLYGWMKHIKH